jgi:hypothetical protein
MIEHVVERCLPMLVQAFFSLIAVTEYEQRSWCCALKCSDRFTDREHEMAYLSLNAVIA